MHDGVRAPRSPRFAARLRARGSRLAERPKHARDRWRGTHRASRARAWRCIASSTDRCRGIGQEPRERRVDVARRARASRSPRATASASATIVARARRQHAERATAPPAPRAAMARGRRERVRDDLAGASRSARRARRRCVRAACARRAPLICWPTIARTASSKPSNVPGHAQARMRRRRAHRARGDLVGMRTPRSNACATRASTCGTTRASDADTSTHERGRARRRRTTIHARVHGRRDARSPACADTRVAVDRLDAGDGARARGSRASRRSRTAAGTRARSASPPAQRAGGRAPAQARRRHAVARLPQRVEAAHAAKSARERDLRHRQRRVGEQALREQQPLRLRVLDRRDAERAIEDAAQCRLVTPSRCRQRFEAAVVEHAAVDQLDGRLREALGRVDARIAGRQLRPAAQARPVPCDLRRGRAREVAAVSRARRAHAADRPAVDARRRHADEEASVEARVVRRQRAVAACRHRSPWPHYPPPRDRRLAVFGPHHRACTRRRRLRGASCRIIRPRAASGSRPMPHASSDCSPCSSLLVAAAPAFAQPLDAHRVRHRTGSRRPSTAGSTRRSPRASTASTAST